MGKTTKIVTAAASVFVVIAGVIAYLVYFDVFGSDLPRYAPPGTDEIHYTNYKKFSRTRIFRAYQKTLGYEKMAEEAKKNGLDPDKLDQYEQCVFRNRNAEMDGKGFGFTSVYRGSQAEALFKWQMKRAQESVAAAEKTAEEEKKKAEAEGREPGKFDVPKFSADKIGGKEAFTLDRGGAKMVTILLAKNMVQSSDCFEEKGSPVSAPLKKESTPATRAIDTAALYSYAWVVKLPDKYRAELGKNEKGAAIGLKIVRVNVYESGSSDIEVKAEFIYENDGQAKAAEKFLVELRREHVSRKHFRIRGCPFIDGKSGAEILGSAEVSRSGKKIVAKAKFSQNTIARRIEEEDKERRANKQ